MSAQLVTGTGPSYIHPSPLYIVEVIAGLIIIVLAVIWLVHKIGQYKADNAEYEYRVSLGPIWQYDDEKGLTYDEYLHFKYGDLPGMWDESDLANGWTDAEPTPNELNETWDRP